MARSEPCAICGGSSGLFGYATEDGFICKKCLERAGLKKAAAFEPFDALALRDGFFSFALFLGLTGADTQGHEISRLSR